MISILKRATWRCAFVGSVASARPATTCHFSHGTRAAGQELLVKGQRRQGRRTIGRRLRITTNRQARVFLPTTLRPSSGDANSVLVTAGLRTYKLWGIPHRLSPANSSDRRRCAGQERRDSHRHGESLSLRGFLRVARRGNRQAFRGRCGRRSPPRAQYRRPHRQPPRAPRHHHRRRVGKESAD